VTAFSFVPSLRVNGVVLAGLICVVALAHGGAIRNGFLYDDFHLIAENPALSSHSWGAIWTSSDTASRDAAGRAIRPVTMTTYALDHAWGGGAPWPYHATQLGLHALVVGLVYLVAARVTGRVAPAIVAALLVGLHPVQTEAVQYLSARSSILSALGMLAAFWWYLTARRDPPRRLSWVLSGLAFALAVLSKEVALVFVLWLVTYETLVMRAPPRTVVRVAAPYAGLATALWVGPRLLMGEAGIYHADVSTERALATGAVVLARHVSAWFAPIGIAPVSPQPWITAWSDPAAVWALLVVGFVLFGALGVWRALPLVSFGLVCAISALLPVMVLPFLTDVAMFQPHRGYAASVGFALATVAAVTPLADRVARWAGRSGREGAVAAIAWVLGVAVLGVVLWADARQGRSWRNEVGFWTDAVERHPTEGLFHHSLGAARLRADDPPGALDAFTTALRLDPASPRVQYNLGLVYTKLGRISEAVASYERAVERDPTDVKSLANLGLLYERSGESEQALRAYRAALRVSPTLDRVRARADQLDRGFPVPPHAEAGR
jgi:hypothetical protein